MPNWLCLRQSSSVYDRANDKIQACFLASHAFCYRHLADAVFDFLENRRGNLCCRNGAIRHLGQMSDERTPRPRRVWRAYFLHRFVGKDGLSASATFGKNHCAPMALPGTCSGRYFVAADTEKYAFAILIFMKITASPPQTRCSPLSKTDIEVCLAAHNRVWYSAPNRGSSGCAISNWRMNFPRP